MSSIKSNVVIIESQIRRQAALALAFFLQLLLWASECQCVGEWMKYLRPGVAMELALKSSHKKRFDIQIGVLKEGRHVPK